MSLPLTMRCYYPFVSAASAAEREAYPAYRMERAGPEHHARRELQNFIAASFLETYSAEVSHFCHTLVGCRDPQGRLVAALGFTLAGEGTTFLEQYLDDPLEAAIASRTGTTVERHQIVEVGNLSATHAGAARTLIVEMTRYLHRQGLAWVAFTATRSLLNSFVRLRLKPMVVAEADPRRLPDGGQSWGSYYASKPQVMFGDIGSGYARLAE